MNHGYHDMSEPASGAAAGLAGWKLIGGLAGLGAIGAGLATVVVMCMTPPKSKREWAVALVSTVMGSIGGGAGVIQYWSLQHWAYTPFGLVSMLGLVFACGLPGWAIVRWLFNFTEKRRNADIAEIVSEVRQHVAGAK